MGWANYSRFATVVQHQQYSSLSSAIQSVASELDGLIDIFDQRGRDFQQALGTINDAIIESHLDLLAHEGYDAAADYRHQLEHAQMATNEIDLNTGYFEALVTDLLHAHSLLMRELMPLPPSILEFRGVLHSGLQQYVISMGNDVTDLVAMLREGLGQLEASLTKARQAQPQMDLEARDIQNVVEKTIRQACIPHFPILHD